MLPLLVLAGLGAAVMQDRSFGAAQVIRSVGARGCSEKTRNAANQVSRSQRGCALSVKSDQLWRQNKTGNEEWLPYKGKGADTDEWRAGFQKECYCCSRQLR